MLLTTTDLLSVVAWSRAQFAMTAIYHWLFVPLTLGLGFICAFMETIYYRTGDEYWKRTTKFWMKLFGINFAIGIATGLILEFEFGTNWSNYSHFVGDIFGAPLAIEGIMAFFLEATFIAVMFFGWDKVSKGFHLTSTWLTAFGATVSALWILVANSWMQYPVGMTFNIETARNEMTSFWEVVLSPVAINKFFHTVLSGYILGSVFVAGLSAWFLLKKRERRMAKDSMKVAAIFGLVCSIFAAISGDRSAKLVARVQPMKLASLEALYDGQRGADLTVISIMRPARERVSNETVNYWEIKLPKMLSYMSFGNTDAYVPGINDLLYGNEDMGIISTTEKIERGRVVIDEIRRFQQAKESGDEEVLADVKMNFDPNVEQGRQFMDNYYRYFGYGYLNSPQEAVPNIPLVFYCFRIMVGLGFYFIIMFAGVLFLLHKNTIEKRRWILYILLWSIPLGYLAGQAGWVVTEFGRQPWTIQELLPTVAAVSRLDSGSVIVTFFMFLILFTALLIAEIKIMTKQIKLGPGRRSE
ncbi:MAG: cytochrome ubiquinol oxidase subunit I [Rikenellaceae bacterium]|nr:cytochrome ubiquinol oxidase subunit I [Rikenellaceae bacterium]